MVYKVDFKNLFQSSLKDKLTKKEKQTKKKDNMEVYDESLDMNAFGKLKTRSPTLYHSRYNLVGDNILGDEPITQVVDSQIG
jgi:hypothetical protein